MKIERSKTILAILLLSAFCVGCMSRAEHAAWRDAYHDATATMRGEYREFAAAIARQPDSKPLPDLSQQPQTVRDSWFKARTSALDAAESSYQSDKSHDQLTPSIFGGK